jgi:hypothetical protein
VAGGPSILPSVRSTVGFDRLWCGEENYPPSTTSSEISENQNRISLALVGFTPADVTAEQNLLTAEDRKSTKASCRARSAGSSV